MESITSTTNTNEQDYVAIPSEVGAGGYLRISGDPGVLQDLYAEQVAAQRQAVVEAPKRVFNAVTGYLGGVASSIKLEAKMAVFDTIHGTNYRDIRHELIEQERRRRFETSIGIMAVRK